MNRVARSRFICICILSSLPGLAGCRQQEKETLPPLTSAEWHEFQGTWTATGNRQSIALGADRHASIAKFEGAVMLSGDSRPGVGFRADVVILSDTATGLLGRAVWTDERGDQAFSELKGEGTTSENKIVGTFLGGTGRYAGATGDYEFSWRFLLENEDGTVQGESLGLKGRVRTGAPQVASAGGPKL